MKTMHYRY